MMGAWPQMRGIFGSIRQQKFVSLRANQNFGKTEYFETKTRRPPPALEFSQPE